MVEIRSKMKKTILVFLLLLIGCKKDPIPTHIQYKRATENIFALKSAVYRCDKWLVDNKWHNEAELVSKLLDLVHYRENCIMKATEKLDKRFFMEQQNRNGFLGYVPPANCEEQNIDYRKTIITMKNGKLYAITENEEKAINDCYGYPLPQNADDIRPNSFYLKTLTNAYTESAKCFNNYIFQIKNLVKLDKKHCKF